MIVRNTLLSVVAGLLLAVPAADAFDAPMTVTAGAGASASGAAVARNAAGGVSVAWVRASDHAVVLRRAQADGGLGPVVPVSGAADASSGTPPALAATAGATIVGWVRQADHHLVVRRLDDSGALGPTWDVSGASVSEINGQAAVATNPSGRVAVAWRRPNDSHVSYRTFDAASGPSAGIVDLTAEPDIALFGTLVQVSIGGDGVGVVVWHRNTDCHIIARRVTAGSVAAAQQDISGQPDSAVGDTNPTVVIDSGGDALVGWHRDSDHHAVLRRWNADATLAAVQDVSAGDVPSLSNFGIAAPSTHAVISWQRASDLHVMSTTAGPDGVAPPTDVSQAASATGTAPSTTVAKDGSAAVAWRTSLGEVQLAFAVGGGAPSDPGNVGSVTEPSPATGGTPTDSSPPASSTPPTTALPSGLAGNRPGTSPRASRLRVPTSATVRGRVVRVRLRCVGETACVGKLVLRFADGVVRRRLSIAAGHGRTISVRTPRSVGVPRRRALGFTVLLRGRRATRGTLVLVPGSNHRMRLGR